MRTCIGVNAQSSFVLERDWSSYYIGPQTNGQCHIEIGGAIEFLLRVVVNFFNQADYFYGNYLLSSLIYSNSLDVYLG